MGNMFRCTLKSGGASGTGIPLIVTCSDDFAGKTITATDGTTTLTETCPSASPYTVQFDLPNTGSWTISGVIEGVTYSETISVTEYQLDLESGFSYRRWVSLGGLDPDDYASLSAVFADEEAVRRLMLVHASADYLIDCVTDNIDDIDDFCANDTAMKWLGLCDYVCDGLTAITGVETKLLASTYWERYLKDHVPVMTSNTAPYGEASASSAPNSSRLAWNAFDRDSVSQWQPNSVFPQTIQYKSANPICVRRVDILPTVSSNNARVKDFKVQGSNDGTNFTDIYSGTCQNANEIQTFKFSNAAYYLYNRISVTSSYDGSNIGIIELQFYGRQLSVSVPVMTSNTAPYGQVITTSTFAPANDYKPFGRSLSESNNQVYYQISNGINIDYEFTGKFRPVMLTMKSQVGDYELYTYKVSGGQSGTFEEIAVSEDKTTVNGYSYIVANLNASKDYDTMRITPLTTSDNPAHTMPANQYWTAHAINFYGKDYSEKEFEAGSTKKWLYDHGVLLDGINLEATAYNTQGGTTSNEGYPFAPVISANTDSLVINQNLDASSHPTIGQIFVNKMYDLTNYSNLFFKVEKARVYDPSHAYQIIGAAITSTKANYFQKTAETTIVSQGGSSAADVSTGNKLMNVDVSSINQTEYLLFYLRSVGLLVLSEFWLE